MYYIHYGNYLYYDNYVVNINYTYYCHYFMYHVTAVFLNVNTSLCIARNGSDFIPGIHDADILLEDVGETPDLNVEAVSHAIYRLR